MPDMDIDFAVAGRDRVINYVKEKYGRDRVAQIITFGTMLARAAVRDAGRVLEVPYGQVDRIAKMIPEGPKVYLDDCLQAGAELKQAYDTDRRCGALDMASARGLVPPTRSLRGVVSSTGPLTEYFRSSRRGRHEVGRNRDGEWSARAPNMTLVLRN